MAAYAALNSLRQMLDRLLHHPSPPVSLPKQQAQSLTQILDFLLEFLQGYNSPFPDSEEPDPLLRGIADATYAVEDILESCIADKIEHGESTSQHEVNQEDLQKVIEEMETMKKVAMKTEKAAVPYQLVSQSGSPSTGQNKIMVGLDDVLLQTMEKLTAGRVDRQVIPVVGMGGMGKTTLARNIYADPLIKEHFDVCSWATISQEYNTKEILCEVLSQAQNDESKERLRRMSEDAVGLALYQYLSRRRFLIVMDDMWSIEAWDKIKRLFPDDSNGSRILVTTRQSELGSLLDEESGPQMRFLDEVSSWDLFSRTVFGETSCPPELKEIAKDIVRNCKGLPLSIVVAGGLLKRLEHTPECWVSIRKNLSSAVNLENDKQCLKVLKMSYNYLSVHLKPCFLYTGVFEEDSRIRVSTLIRLWDGEGFLKPESGKSMKTIGKEYVKQLVDRNLVLLENLGCTGNIKYLKIHDLVRDVCLREAERERFYHVITQDSPQEIGSQRRIVIPRSTSEEKAIHALRSSSHARSIISDENIDFGLSSNLRLLRVLQTFREFSPLKKEGFLKDAFEFCNLRHLRVGVHSVDQLPSSINLLWDLQTLILYNSKRVKAPVEIWKMTQLRHVEFAPRGLYLPDPPRSDVDEDVIMENVHTLVGVMNLEMKEEVIRRIPNVLKLRIDYSSEKGMEADCLNNLERLHKLESFICSDWGSQHPCVHRLNFPCSLKKLMLTSRYVDWEDVLDKIGCLPLLQKLTLGNGYFRRGKWETKEGQFPNLRFLSLVRCRGLEYWRSEGSPFPRLETLELTRIYTLKKMCSEMGEIATLRLIVLCMCDRVTVEAAKEMVKEQEEFLGEEQLGFHVQVNVDEEWEALPELVRQET